MVIFLPFPGYRPALKNGEKIDDRISPPYDVIDKDYLNRLQSLPRNVTRLTLMPENGRYGKSRKELDSWIDDGSLAQDPDSFYFYRQTFSDNGNIKTRTGIVGILKTENYSEGNIIPHEETFSKVKDDRLNLLRDMETHLESIFGIYDGLSPALNERISENVILIYSYKDDSEVLHQYYRISDPMIMADISDEMECQKMLIADGHHRYETALNYSEENPDDEMKGFVLATMVAGNDDGLVRWPTHRLIRGNDISEKNAIRGISGKMDLTEADGIQDLRSKLKDHTFGILFKSGKCYLADHKGEGLWNLDTYVAQELVMKGVYKSDDGKADIAYDAEFGSAVKKVENGEYDAVLLFNEPGLDTIWNLSLAGKRMPKKTTFFFPKIWSGWVFYKMG
ncbi:MAG: DUF1015 domain-containing protein [Thermoplasmatales archaeon]|nr:DUF1015 domain-containing protein [Thermoplasmatales archaeon]